MIIIKKATNNVSGLDEYHIVYKDDPPAMYAVEISFSLYTLIYKKSSEILMFGQELGHLRKSRG